jgi:DNA polymerase III subunit gamma/tau
VATVAAVAVAVEEPPPAGDRQVTDDPGQLLGHVLSELENAGHKMLASTLGSGSVALEGNELKVTIPQPTSVIDLMMGSEPRRVANAAASAALGRAVKVNVVSGIPASGNGAAAVVRPRNGASARSRAAEDPVVQRMREKFGAEIRTVIDHREKN